jgi:hypothetical protein
VRAWLHDTMGWSRRRGTRAAQKLPENWEDQCEKSAKRKGYLIKEYDIPAELYANSDQTQRLYAAGNQLTYAETGSRQVSILSGDEKRAFTVLVTVTSAGLLLPFQAIYHGKTNRSCPRPTLTNHYKDAIDAGFRFEFSGTDTYWSNQRTMRDFVDHMLAPYFERMKVKLGRPPQQRSLWQIDVWSVHRSKEFLDWMRTNHPTILIDFVPGGCTGVAQPCDVGIQRLFKHITNRAYLEDVVAAILTQIDGKTEKITFDDNLPILRDASVRWMWLAYQALNKVDIVQKVSYRQIRTSEKKGLPETQAFELCVVREWNLSYATLRSFNMQGSLRKLRDDDPEFWSQLTRADEKLVVGAVVDEDVVPDVDHGNLDDTDVSLRDVVIATHQKGRPRGRVLKTIEEDGGLRSTAEAELLDSLPKVVEDEGPAKTGRGKRQRTANRLYKLDDFARHWDNESSDVE